ncbi:MAG TPA: hypothetical protein PLH56_01310 [Candidatus Omnitrophota bacterium]|nr:hypothetical protein [Candidatus Omnitrophota bacterium]
MLVTLSKECTDFSTRLEILPQMISATFQQPTQAMIVRSNPFQVYAIRWFDENRILFTSGIITKHHLSKPIENPKTKQLMTSINIQETTATFALELKEKLPAGTIDKTMLISPILEIVARSFGLPVTCHPEEPAAFVYNGRWDGQTIKFLVKENDHYQVSGAFNLQKKCCQNVWVFSFNSYKKWFSEN